MIISYFIILIEPFPSVGYGLTVKTFSILTLFDTSKCYRNQTTLRQLMFIFTFFFKRNTETITFYKNVKKHSRLGWK